MDIMGWGGHILSATEQEMMGIFNMNLLGQGRDQELRVVNKLELVGEGPVGQKSVGQLTIGERTKGIDKK